MQFIGSKTKPPVGAGLIPATPITTGVGHDEVEGGTYGVMAHGGGGAAGAGTISGGVVTNVPLQHRINFT